MFHRPLRLVVVLLLSVLVGVCGASKAGTAEDIELLKRNGPQIAAILSQVVGPNGVVDEATHDKFWRLFPASIRTNPKSFVENLDVIRSMTYQKELWESIRLSARAGTVVKTIAYHSSFVKALGESSTGKDAEARAERMLAAAAAGRPLQTEKGTLLLSEDEANRVLDSLNGSTTRLQLLTDPVWRGLKASK